MWVDPSKKGHHQTFSPTCLFGNATPRHFGCPHLAALKIPLPTPGLDAVPGHYPPPFTALTASFQTIVRYAKTFQARGRLSRLVQSLGHSLMTQSIQTPVGDSQYNQGQPRDEIIVLKEHILDMERLPIPVCSSCQDSSSMARLHACLTCCYIGCWSQSHIQEHMKETGHHMIVDFNHGTLFCGKCNDYIYDLDLDGVRNDETARIHAMMALLSQDSMQDSQPRLKRWVPTNQDILTIQSNSQLLKCHGLRGLRNLGATCFMSVILQAFVHNPFLRNYFLSHRHTPSTCNGGRNGICLACEMTRLFQNFYDGSTTPFGPASFLAAMWSASKQLAGYSQQDAHEFFISVLNEIHSNMGQEFKMMPCECIIHETFSGVLQSNVKCTGCQNVTTTLDPFIDISLELRRESTDGQMHEPFGKHGIKYDSTLLDCLSKFTHPEILASNQYHCNRCGDVNAGATKQLSVKVLPPVLSFQIKRYEHNQSVSNGSKLDSKIYIPHELNMTPFMTHSLPKADRTAGPPNLAHTLSNTSLYQNQQQQLTGLENDDVDATTALNDGLSLGSEYSLFSVVKHVGKMDTGHYTCYAKCGEEWFEFDDQMVSRASPAALNSGNAYMCFYVRKEAQFKVD